MECVVDVGARVRSDTRACTLRHGLLVASALLLGGVMAAAEPAGPVPLTLDERVAFQAALEQVYHRNRTWPEENPGPKPPFEQLVPPHVLREKVMDTLSKAAALDVYWRRPVTGAQLQAEIDRIVRDSRDAALLEELFAALDGDPRAIAECLALPILVDRQIRSWYAQDARLHAAVRAEAERVAKSIDTLAQMRRAGGSYRELELIRGETGAEPGSSTSRIEVADGDWDASMRDLERAIGGGVRDPIESESALRIGRPGRLEEDGDRFVIRAIVSKAPGRVRVATLEWRKPTFESWWARAGVLPVPVPAPAHDYVVPRPASAGPCVADTWRWYGEPPTPRSLHTAIWTGAEMIVWGGVSGGGALRTGSRYDPATDTWAPVNGSGAPSPRLAHSAIWTGTEMILWGGSDNGGVLNSGGRYDPVADAWLATGGGPALPGRRNLHTAVWTGTEMIVWGGQNVTSTTFDTGGRYDPATDAWVATSTGANVPAARSWHTTVWTGTEMIVWGGKSGASLLGTGGRYRPATDSWLPTSSASAPSGRCFHVGVWTGSDMVVWGGVGTAGREMTGGRYAPANDSWLPTSTGAQVPAARINATAVWTGSEMIVWGGTDVAAPQATGGRYDPVTDAWTATGTGSAPQGRSFHTAVWTGSEMIVWGGNDSNGEIQTGGRYAPSSDSWVATNNGPFVPEARAGHCAVWTGVEMIVWGGSRDYYLQYQTGGRYQPATDSWQPTSTGPGVPVARGGPSGVWTGSRMVVWGGWDPTTTFDSGGAYDPVADSWTPTSTTNAPIARVGHSTVWTGTAMIVWGGFDGNASYLRSGGRYEAATDTWSATSIAADTPSGRMRHSGVWTGSEMIVWGGWDDFNWFDTGARYDPATDAWRSTSTGANVPTPRELHSAVWTGSEMVVWGGNTASAGPGGRYDPVADLWQLVSTTGEPSDRLGESAVWTGSEMIVWGGQRGQATYDTGGRYDPATDFWVPTGGGPYLPAASAWPSAVFTGSEMIVWGGQRGNITVSSGGAYCVCSGVVVAPSSLPGAVLGQPYTATLSASGGTAPYTFDVAAGALPPGLVLGASGVLSGTPTAAGSFAFTVAATDATSCMGTEDYALSVQQAAGSYLLGEGLGNGPGNTNRARVHRSDGTPAGVDFQAYGAGRWGTNVAAGDIDGGTFAEILTGPGPGDVYGPQVRAFTGAGSAIPKVSFFAYGTLRYGVNVAAGALDGDAFAEMLSGAGPGAVFGPHVRGWEFDGTVLSAIPKVSFFAYGTLRYGVNVAAGDVDADGVAAILTGPGPGPTFGAQVRGFDYDGTGTTSIPTLNYVAMPGDHGVNVAGGDVDGDGHAEITAAAGPGPVNPSLFVGHDHDGVGISPLPGFSVAPYGSLYGARVGLVDIVGDGAWDLLAGAGRDPAAGSRVEAYGYDGASLQSLPGSGFVPFATPGYGFGVNVAGGGFEP